MSDEELYTYLAGRRLSVLSIIGPRGGTQPALDGYAVAPELIWCDTRIYFRAWPDGPERLSWPARTLR